MDVSKLSNEELVTLQKDILKEQDDRKPLDPLPWTWPSYSTRAPRNATGPGNDGPPYPNGTLSQISPRPGYRQDHAAYAHTQTWFPGLDPYPVV